MTYAYDQVKAFCQDMNYIANYRDLKRENYLERIYKPMLITEIELDEKDEEFFNFMLEGEDYIKEE